MIPVISYREDDFITDAQLKNDVDNYHSSFSSSPIAIRITSIQYNQISNLNQIPLTADDYLILDIGKSKHNQEALLPIYQKIKNYKSQNGITTCIINNPRPSDLYNSKLIDRRPIKEIDNSLLKHFHSFYGFDGLGDYSGITSDLPATRRSQTRVGIYYSAANNYFIGYIGRNANHFEYAKYIAPSILASPYWNEFSSEHHLNCPGCSSIQDIANGGTGKTPTKWKEITMTHYIYTVDQIMQQ